MKGRQLPLNIELEHAAIHACLKGELATDQLHIEELSKTGQAIFKAVVGLGGKGKSPSTKAVLLSASEFHGGDVGDLRTYMKAVNESEMPEIEEVLETLARKRAINAVVNEATDQIATGDYSLLGIKDLVDKTASPKNKLVPLRERMGKKIAPPVGIHVPSLPSINRELNGIYGVVVIQGEPAAGKSTLGLQIGVSVSVERPVLYYDFEQGEEVMAWHISEMFAGNRSKIDKYTENFYVRHTLTTLERDLGMLRVPSLVVVDSIQKVSHSISHKRETIDSVVHKLEALKKYGHHVIFISEKGRASYGNPSMSGSKETGEIEYAGDAVYDVMKVSEDTSELWVVKNRHYKFTGLLTALVRENSWRFREAGRSSNRID